MKQKRVLSIAILFLLLGTTALAYAQKGREGKGGGGQKAQQVKSQQPPQHAKQAQRSQPAQHTRHAQQRGKQQGQRVAHNRGNNGFHGKGNNGNHYGQIPDARFRASFGRDHWFRIHQPRMYNGYSSFQYGGYWFGFVDPWPASWYYSDAVYVDYYGNVYYLYNRRHPGARIALRIAL